MRIRVLYKGQERVFSSEVPDITIGRSKHGHVVDLDLVEDRTVSGNHARIWLEEGHYWIQDLNSLCGTRVNDTDIKGKGKLILVEGASIHLGETTLHFVSDDAPAATGAAWRITDKRVETPEKIAHSIGAETGVFSLTGSAASKLQKRLALFYELPLQLGQERHLDALLQAIVERLVDTIPRASRGALLVQDTNGGELLLKAQVPAGEPAISMTLARRAMEERKGFVWQRGEEDVTSSIAGNEIASGMYAPLMWKGAVLGVICVDMPRTSITFGGDDLRLLVAIAQHASMALAHHQLQEDSRRNSVLLTRLLTNFSPRIRERLLEKASHGRLRLGGEKSEVTILFSDIRGFTNLSAGMDTDSVVDLLNDYFSALVDPIFKNDGTIDKFVGDAILAVFGSPEADPQQYDKAVRAAFGMQKAMEEMNKKRAEKGEVTCGIGVGIHCGEVLHGFIGSADHMEFTVIGDAVNRASRYCSAANAGEVLISPDMHQRVWRLVKSERKIIPTKHEGDLVAFRLENLKGPRPA
ncbi:MAG: adenylate/guanylate cyclase domain-containing protein [Candidatus Acidiferrales bacterium]